MSYLVRFSLCCCGAIFVVISTCTFVFDSSYYNSSGEFNSNWGRLIRTMRVRLDSPILLDDGWNSLGTAKQVLQDQLPKFTKVLDTRVAWGPTHARMPGS